MTTQMSARDQNKSSNEIPLAHITDFGQTQPAHSINSMHESFGEVDSNQESATDFNEI